MFDRHRKVMSTWLNGLFRQAGVDQAEQARISAARALEMPSGSNHEIEPTAVGGPDEREESPNQIESAQMEMEKALRRAACKLVDPGEIGSDAALEFDGCVSSTRKAIGMNSVLSMVRHRRVDAMRTHLNQDDTPALVEFLFEVGGPGYSTLANIQTGNGVDTKRRKLSTRVGWAVFGPVVAARDGRAVVESAQADGDAKVLLAEDLLSAARHWVATGLLPEAYDAFDEGEAWKISQVIDQDVQGVKVGGLGKGLTPNSARTRLAMVAPFVPVLAMMKYLQEIPREVIENMDAGRERAVDVGHEAVQYAKDVRSQEDAVSHSNKRRRRAARELARSKALPSEKLAPRSGFERFDECANGASAPFVFGQIDAYDLAAQEIRDSALARDPVAPRE